MFFATYFRLDYFIAYIVVDIRNIDSKTVSSPVVSIFTHVFA